MIQIIDEAPSFMSRVGQGIGKSLSGENNLVKQFGDAIQKRNKDEVTASALERMLGKDLRGLPEEFQKMEYKSKIDKELQNEKYGHEKDLQADKFANEINNPKESKLSPFEQQFQKKIADEYFGIDEEMNKLNAQMQDIGYLREKSREARTPSGIVGRWTGMGSAAAEMDTVAHAQLEPVIKIFNKSGPLAQSKLNALRDVYIPKSSDWQGTIDGKLDGLERLNRRSYQALEAKKQFIESQGGVGNITPQAMQHIDKQVADVINQEVDGFILQNETVSGLVSKQNGKRLKPMPREKAMELVQQGLATYG